MKMDFVPLLFLAVASLPATLGDEEEATSGGQLEKYREVFRWQ